jgi:hypothetical protein
MTGMNHNLSKDSALIGMLPFCDAKMNTEKLPTKPSALFARRSVLWVFSTLVMAMSACGHPAQAPTNEAPPAQNDGKPKMLAINGFNYTDLTISEFSVGSSGGGNIFVSSPTSGGGGTSCCVVWYPGMQMPKPVTIEWMRFVNGRDRWCKKTVLLTGPVPENPTAFGVHFMPDGDIQVEITQGASDPKLKLPRFNAGHRRAEGNVIHDEQTASCKDGR